MQLKFTKKKRWEAIEKPMSKKRIREMNTRISVLQKIVLDAHVAIAKVTWEASSLLDSINYQKKLWEKHDALKIQKTKRERTTSKLRH